MPVLSNELLNAEQLVAEFEAHVVGQHRPISHFQKRLKSVYFEGVEDDARRNVRFSSNYPHLNHALQLIFSLPNDGDAAAALKEMRSYEGLDWEADQADSRLHQFNEQFGFFDPSPASIALFKKLAEASRVIIVLFEQNNTPEDTMAYDYAYKLMALFGPIDVTDLDASFISISSAAHKLMNASVSRKGKPYHEVLLVQTQLPDARALSPETRVAWQTLIKREGEVVLKPFAKAAAIQAAFPDAHETLTLKKARNWALQCHYKRADEDKDFAVLCSQHDVHESVFNGGLDYMRSGWPKKTSDTLPSVAIKDAASGYYWLKLPPNDKRALILGTITRCCQDITGNSMQCVKDAVSLSDNGLYVLLKPKKGRDTGDVSPMKGDEINHDDFDIVGQSYVWRTTAGNICLDSIECQLDAISNDKLQRMMRDFAHEVMRQHPEVKRVNVGQGGKTPPGLFNPTSIPEQMRQGVSYGDAGDQYIIARTPGVNAALSQVMLNDKSTEFCECIDYLSQYTEDHHAFIDQLRELLENAPSIVKELTRQRLMRLFFAGHVPCLDDLYPIDVHAMERMSPEEIERISTVRLIFRANTHRNVSAEMRQT